ncbi:MAG: CBS domain-containing protein [Flavobacteriaceae bacterium]|nr:CBS domain-containing protein [Flavobacteriaceae bacterium]
MQTIDYIVNDVKALHLNDTINKAKLLFKELIFTHIPVINNNNLLGLIAESDIHTLENDATKIEEIQYLFESFYTIENVNWFDLLKNFASNKANIIPVLDKNKKYVGYFELTDILHFFNNTPFLKENGTILVVSKNKENYSLSEVSQIIERNDAKLFGAFISKSEDNIIEITLKLSTQNINEIIQTFRRYDYTIVIDIKEDDYLNNLKERSKYLQKYLNI